MMNEPHRGYIDPKSLHEFDYNTDLHLGVVREWCLFSCRFLSFLSGFFSLLFGSVVLESFLDYLLALRSIRSPSLGLVCSRALVATRDAVLHSMRIPAGLDWAGLGIPSEMNWRVARTNSLRSGLWVYVASSSCARTIQFPSDVSGFFLVASSCDGGRARARLAS
jgi:hypothetical protein